MTVEPELVVDWLGGDLRLTAEGFLRLDPHDGRRNHGDVRTLNLLWLGD
ncbi:MAG: hypothetical protein GWM92_19545, partial [Gemmatimonadetes bacterium]|nr:hypothetical protein [Gemmatimonadota bacterium]NIR81012.1 hypothetical protein [Gemmatimonadota bacterium]NIT89829.1 hypothetical protein [Gemmatimonadota bacterium]NIU33618.1 hypothetical protein [Gemmatimonadota bacterium]NIU37875.1 hypothetical protein [Gemmatimonadota bacterium]